MDSKINFIIEEISNLSYNIFLFHHKLINDVFSIFEPRKCNVHLLLLALTTSLIIICSKIHSIVINSLFESYIFKKLDAIFIK